MLWKMLNDLCIMLKNGHTFKNLGFHTARYLKYVWSFFKILHVRVMNVMFNNVMKTSKRPWRFFLTSYLLILVSAIYLLLFRYLQYVKSVQG